MVKISSFTFKVQQIREIQNIVPDALCRMFEHQNSRTVIYVSYSLPSSFQRFFDNPDAGWGANKIIPEVGEVGTLSFILPSEGNLALPGCQIRFRKSWCRLLRFKLYFISLTVPHLRTFRGM
jgi:hypothetical protein